MSRNEEVERPQKNTHPDEAARVLPLLSDEGNQRLLVDWLASHDRYTAADTDADVASAAFDLCILDGDALEGHAATLKERKQASDPVLLPCLLLLPEADLSYIDVDRGEIADNVLRATVDEIVSLPLKKAELEWRTDALLRLRRQSLALREQRNELRLFRRAAEAAGHAVYITDTDGTIEYVNPAFEEITGYDASEVLGETPALFDSDGPAAAHDDPLWETIAAGEIWEDDTVNTRRDGEQYHANRTVAPVTDATGTPEKFVVIQSDITERVEAKQELRTFRDIVEQVDDPIMFQDTDGKFRVINEAVAEFADRSVSELIGSDEYAFMDEASATYVEARKEQVLDQERTVRYTFSPSLPGDPEPTFSTVRYPHYADDGTLDGTVAICRDVTELRRRDRQLQVIDRVLRHNLRNDMNVIEIFAEELRESGPETVADRAGTILETSRGLRNTLDKQRDITEFLSDPPEKRTLDLVSMATHAARKMREQYPAAEIRTTLPDSCPVTATTAIEKAIVELIENAVVHADTDQPHIDVTVDDARVTVADDGPGIPEMERRILTDGAPVEPLYHGSGLGLWLVAVIVDHSDGSIAFERNQPRGSVVRLELPGA